jgi:hypothetical protein
LRGFREGFIRARRNILGGCRVRRGGFDCVWRVASAWETTQTTQTTRTGLAAHDDAART